MITTRIISITVLMLLSIIAIPQAYSLLEGRTEQEILEYACSEILTSGETLEEINVCIIMRGGQPINPFN